MFKKNATRQVGVEGETIAENYLEEQGYHIIERNARCPLGEIDFVAEHQGTLVFLEVKMRHGTECGWPEEAVGKFKQRKLIRLAQWYLLEMGGEEPPCRFDVLSILTEFGETRIKLIQNAFEIN